MEFFFGPVCNWVFIQIFGLKSTYTTKYLVYKIDKCTKQTKVPHKVVGKKIKLITYASASAG